MSLTNEKRQEIIMALLKEIKHGCASPSITISERFDLTRQTVHRYLKKLVEEGKVVQIKENKQNKYELKTEEFVFRFSLKDLEEDTVWLEKIKPLFNECPKNVIDICSYGFTEMLNNAIDHSESSVVLTIIRIDPVSYELIIKDDGIGIFNKIQQSLELENPKQSILELAKGKFTTDPRRHSGEGIFFTSRAFDVFNIFSGQLSFCSGHKGKIDVLFEEKKVIDGTLVKMVIDKNSNIALKEVFDQYTATNDDSYGFSKTYIPVSLVDHEGMMLVSRSQAKRLIRRFDRFIEVVLDFEGVAEVGQAFADELFRVFVLEYPQVELIPINMNDDVKKMVLRATNKLNQ